MSHQHPPRSDQHTGHDEHAGHHEHQPSGQADVHPDHDHPGHEGHVGHEHHGHDSGGHGQEGQHHAGHEAHGGHAGHGHGDHGDHVGQFRRLFWIMLVLGIPVVAFNPMFADLLGYQLSDAWWVWWVSPILGTIIYFWGGQPFLTGVVSDIPSCGLYWGR